MMVLEIYSFSSGFRKWLTEELNSSSTKVMSSETRSWFHSLFATSTWYLDEKLLNDIRPVLMYLCAYYLTEIKHSRTGYARDPVANFHLHNGAVIWRLNWLADRSERGWNQSLSIMVNYRYYTFDKIDQNSIDYIDKKTIQIDEQVLKLLKS
jgi:malonyl-CoA decarboxylase